MAKAKKREPLVVGQRVFIEIYGGWVTIKERRINEYEVVDANQTSAYAVSVDNLEKYHSDENKFKYFKERINLKTHEIPIDSIGYSRRLWLTKEAFERNVQYNEEKKELRAEAIQLVNQMNVKELRKVLEIL